MTTRTSRRSRIVNTFDLRPILLARRRNARGLVALERFRAERRGDAEGFLSGPRVIETSGLRVGQFRYVNGSVFVGTRLYETQPTTLRQRVGLWLLNR